MSEIHQPDHIEPKTPHEENESPESPIAFQKPSKGGHLKAKEKSGFGDWFFFLITFQWLTALFTSSTKEQTEADQLANLYFPGNSKIAVVLSTLSDVENHNLGLLLKNDPPLINYIRSIQQQELKIRLSGLLLHPEDTHKTLQLFSNIQTLLGNRLTDKEAESIIPILLEKGFEFRNKLTLVLQQAILLENGKLDGNYPHPESEEVIKFKEALSSAQNEVEGGRWIPALLQDIAFEVTGLGTPATADFSLQMVQQGSELSITDPRSQDTYTVETAQLTENNRAEAIAKGIYSLKNPITLSSRQLLEKWIKKGVVYEVSSGPTTYLALSPRIQDLLSTSFFEDKTLILTTARLIKTPGNGEIVMPIDTPQGILLGQKVKVTSKIEAQKCEVTLTYQKLTDQTLTYTITYPLEQNETSEQLANRVQSDRTLERDLLLARSYFARALEKVGK